MLLFLHQYGVGVGACLRLRSVHIDLNRHLLLDQAPLQVNVVHVRCITGKIHLRLRLLHVLLAQRGSVVVSLETCD